MGGEVYQAQVLKNFFDTITGTDRNLTRIYMCVISLAKLRGEDVETVGHLVEQLRQSKVKKELSIDVLDYMCDIARDLEITAVKTAFGVKEISDVIQDFDSVSLDSL
ncbi:MAG TPA: hypothetical protein PLG55_02860 [Methanospirillum sp.]|jgi:hypothetical protein|uniref:hypothetical protein n=1 Tax=Methanospirillum sp. TaxID=45200 RepID=UPI0009D1BD0E|nr:hypothetical protein [Methanospirillum sp.]NLL11659.1 hypothetical protein [Methanomicrobiales archaeon]OQB37977.1 MAG: hypothetical protein BWY05_00591 [Euryarchaeota archaeon ADurb.Bin165]HPY59651.1 hypothetical protein [Methanospirillum sp.]HQC00310.1 hypothetical protein [Methanospirillum sp.]